MSIELVSYPSTARFSTIFCHTQYPTSLATTSLIKRFRRLTLDELGLDSSRQYHSTDTRRHRSQPHRDPGPRGLCIRADRVRSPDRCSALAATSPWISAGLDGVYALVRDHRADHRRGALGLSAANRLTGQACQCVTHPEPFPEETPCRGLDTPAL
jgi:hypothetical protein